MKSPHVLTATILPNLLAGLTSGLLTLVYSISFAALIFSENLLPYFPQGVGTALIGAAVTAMVVAWRSAFPFALAGPEANSAIILALAARSIAEALDAPQQQASVYPTVWAAIILSTVASGFFLYLLGRFRLGQLARYVPYPVIGGFMAGTGWLVTRSSFKVMTGVPLGFAELPRLMQGEIACHWIYGVAVATMLFLVLARFRHFLVLPGLLLTGAVVGNIAWWLINTGLSVSLNPDEWFFKPFSRDGQWQAWAYSTFSQIDWIVLSHQAGTLLAMIPIVVLSILLNSTGLELATARNVDLNGELRANGVANLINGACGGMVGYISINRCIVNQRAGASSPLAAMMAGGICGSVLLFGSAFLSRFPKPLLGGLLLYIGATLLIQWLYKSWWRLPRFDYLLVVFIVVVVGTVGFLPGVASGILIACVLFIVSYGKTSNIRYALSGKTCRSNVFRSRAQQQLLEREGDSVAILALHGFVFFGTANDLLDGVRRRLAQEKSRPLTYALFDFHLVTGLDSSAVFSFLKLAQLAGKARLSLVFTHVSPVIHAQFRRSGLSFGTDSSVQTFADLDRGLEWCENQILNAHQMLQAPVLPLTPQLEGLLKDVELASQLKSYLQPIDLAQEEYLFRQNDASDGLYFLESGRVSVVIELSNGISLRRNTYTEGTILGEMGFFSGTPRSASVIADWPSRLHYLSKHTFQKFEADAPQLASSLKTGIINLVAERLRRAEEQVKILLQ